MIELSNCFNDITSPDRTHYTDKTRRKLFFSPYPMMYCCIRYRYCCIGFFFYCKIVPVRFIFIPDIFSKQQRSTKSQVSAGREHGLIDERGRYRTYTHCTSDDLLFIKSNICLNCVYGCG